MRVQPAHSGLPRAVWALGLVSLLMDLSSEMVHSLLPIYLTTVVGASVLVIGIIEGISEATAAMTKLVSGTWSDRMRRRKPLTVAGYALAALAKPLFPLAASAADVFLARFLDRLGKGLRGAPRDALVTELTAPPQRGAAFGLRQALDTVGALLGPLIAAALMLAFAGDIRLVFWVACLPAGVAVWVLVRAVPESPRVERTPSLMHEAGWRNLPRSFWLLLGVGALFTLMRFSEAFLLLRAQERGWPVALIPLALALMSAAYALTAYPAGRLSDRWPRTRLLALGCLVMAAADLNLAFAADLAGVAVGLLLWGLHMGLTEGLLSALVADHAPPMLRGTAFGLFHSVRGIALLLASVLAGALWNGFGASAPFLGGAAVALLSALAVLRLPAPR